MKKKVIGITGGIGCGKSAVMSLLEEKYKGAVLLTDQIGHDLMEPGEINYKGIVAHFGTDFLDETKHIDRKKLGNLVFQDPEKLEQLNQLTHPNILKETKHRIEQLKENPDVSMVCLESALLLDTPLCVFCDEIWYIYADQETRVARLMEGRNYTREYCLSVMEKQLSETYFLEKADVVIDNSGSLEQTKEQLKKIIK